MCKGPVLCYEAASSCSVSRVYRQTLVSRLHAIGLVQNQMCSKVIQLLSHLTCVSLWMLLENINQTHSINYPAGAEAPCYRLHGSRKLSKVPLFGYGNRCWRLQHFIGISIVVPLSSSWFRCSNHHTTCEATSQQEKGYSCTWRKAVFWSVGKSLLLPCFGNQRAADIRNDLMGTGAKLPILKKMYLEVL